MSRDGSVDFTWGGDLRQFRLSIDQCLALEEKCNSSLGAIFQRLASGGWYVRDVRETIRLGLIGKGVDAKVAQRLVDEQCGDGRLQEGVLAAFAILTAAIQAPPDEPEVGKEGAAAEAPETNVSPPPPSTEAGRSSASRRQKSAR